MIPEQFENSRNLDGKSSLQHFDAKEAYLHHKSRSVLFQKCLKMYCFHHVQVFTRRRFQNVLVRVLFSKPIRPIRRIFHRFRNVPASCERNLRPRSHGNAIVPVHLRSSFWNAKIDCSHGNGTIAYRFLFLFTRERNRSVPQFSL